MTMTNMSNISFSVSFDKYKHLLGPTNENAMETEKKNTKQ